MKAIGKVLTGKSKTINFNALGMLVVPILAAVGVTIDPTIVAAGFTLLNFVLRFVTKESLAEK